MSGLRNQLSLASTVKPALVYFHLSLDNHGSQITMNSYGESATVIIFDCITKRD